MYKGTFLQLIAGLFEKKKEGFLFKNSFRLFFCLKTALI